MGVGELHLKGEPVTFYCSHGCLSNRQLWLGARAVLSALVRPATAKLALSKEEPQVENHLDSARNDQGRHCPTIHVKA